MLEAWFSYVMRIPDLDKRLIEIAFHLQSGILKVGSHNPILVQLSFQIFLCMMKNVGVHTIQFSHSVIIS